MMNYSSQLNELIRVEKSVNLPTNRHVSTKVFFYEIVFRVLYPFLHKMYSTVVTVLRSIPLMSCRVTQ